MNTAKDEAQSLLQRLPDTCTLEDIQYHLYVIGKIHKGLERAESEGTIQHDDVEQRLRQWLAE